MFYKYISQSVPVSESSLSWLKIEYCKLLNLKPFNLLLECVNITLIAAHNQLMSVTFSKPDHDLNNIWASRNISKVCAVSWVLKKREYDYQRPVAVFFVCLFVWFNNQHSDHWPIHICKHIKGASFNFFNDLFPDRKLWVHCVLI